MSADKKHWIGGQWCGSSGEAFESLNPATGEVLWSGNAAGKTEVDAAVSAARKALKGWSALTLDQRIGYLQKFTRALEKKRSVFAEFIAKEVGKPLWESATEVGAMIGKVDVSVDAFDRRCEEFEGGIAITRFKPHGVVVILGPFNFPGHLPNGHIIPALLAGNTAVLKPSEYAPMVAEEMIHVWEEVGLPEGVLNMVQGKGPVGKALVEHEGVNGVFFTGSAKTGVRLSEYMGSRPEKILALEMGGNNPLVVWKVSDLETVGLTIVQSAYLSAGQRCTCARRLIIPKGEEGDAIVGSLIEWIGRIVVGPYDAKPEPFMGPVINEQAAHHLLTAQEKLKTKGGQVLVEMEHLKPGTGLLSPGLMDVTNVQGREDEEYFGPFLQVIRVDSFEAAIKEANNTRYGLSAGLLCDEKNLYDQFYQEIEAGIVNWNQQITGASSAAPFGGIGISGNHRPSAYFAADYCAYPVASVEKEKLAMPEHLPVGINE